MADLAEQIAKLEDLIDALEFQLASANQACKPELEEALMELIAKAEMKLAKLKEELAEQKAREKWEEARKMWKLPSRPLEELGKGPAPPL